MSLRKDLIGGLVVLLPVAIVVYVAYWVFRNVALIPFPIAPTGTVIDEAIKILIIGTGLLVLLVLAGRGTRTFVGKELESWFDRQMNRIPAVRMLYNASKVALEMALSDGEEFDMPVRVRLTDSLTVTGFKTGADVVAGRTTVFVPTSPNITSGMILYADPDSVERVDETTEEVLSHVLSAGFLGPGEAETEEVESLLENLRR